MSRVRILVNHAFASQRITGQQRYASEISARLRDSPDVDAVAPTGFWAGSTIRTWLWTQLVLPLSGRRSTLVSMTARAPLWRQRHVLVVHDLFVLTNPEWYTRRYIWTHAPLLRFQLCTAAAVVAVSEPVADLVARYRRGPVRVAPNAPSAVFSSGAHAGDDELPTRLTAQDVHPGRYLLAVGNRDPRKNLARLAQAYGRLTAEERRKHPLVVAGGGAAIYRNQDLRWPEGTVDIGFVDDEELRRLYRGARSVVFVSLAEGFGLPLVEAAAAGARSLLVSDIEVFHWICGDQVLYVDPFSVDSITDGLRAEIESPRTVAPRFGPFDWDSSAAVVRDVCDEVAGTPRPEVRAPVADVAVVLASAGRPQLLAEALGTCAGLEGVSFRGVVSVPDERSLPEDRSLLDGWTVVTGVRGLAAQRNAGLDAIPDADVVAFFDDDSVVRPDYLRRAVEFLDAHPEVLGLTGRVLLDGAVRGEVSPARAADALAQSVGEESGGRWSPTRELYGCNFVVRFSGAPGCRFDARLPLYSWLEDHDFARRLKAHGSLAHVEDCVIVHRAAASGGRQAHSRLGYSQVMNPVYLARKGSFPLWLAVQQIFRPVAKNAVLSLAGPQASWRRERLAGNWTAARDAVRGRITPERIVEM